MASYIPTTEEKEQMIRNVYAFWKGRELHSFEEVPLHAAKFLTVLSWTELVKPLAIQEYWGGASAKSVSEKYHISHMSLNRWVEVPRKRLILQKVKTFAL